MGVGCELVDVSAARNGAADSNKITAVITIILRYRVAPE
jgi:hypothetical protein